MKKFPKIVKNKADKTLKRLKSKCPYCDSLNVTSVGGCQTLVGSFRFVNNKSVKVRKMSKWDNNHHWFRDIKCNDCSKVFNKEIANGNVWYTDKEGTVLLGIPSCCFESYNLDCSYCDGHGTVKRIYYKLDGITPFTTGCVIYDFKTGPQQIEAYKCSKCNREDKLDLPPFKERHQPKESSLNWTIREEKGVCVINDYALDKINKF